MNKKHTISLAILAAAILVGCGGSGSGSTNNTTGGGTTGNQSTEVRSLVAYSTQSPVNFYLDQTAIGVSMTDGQVTSYLQPPSNAQTAYLKVAGSQQVLAQAAAQLHSGSYTMLGYQLDSGQAAVEVLQDNLTAQNGQASLRIVNAASGQGAMDFYVVVPGTVLGSVHPNYSNVTDGAASGYTAVQPGTTYVYGTQAGTKTVLFSANLNLSAGQVRTLVLQTTNGQPTGMLAADAG